jgi:hypothetical protein
MNDFKLEMKHQIGLLHEKLEVINQKLENRSGPDKHAPREEGTKDLVTASAKAKSVKGLKRSFLARFLEDDDDHPAAKDKPDKGKGKSARSRLLESVFGICDADPKQGREASSVIHPQSPFATGLPAPAPSARPMAAHRGHGLPCNRAGPRRESHRLPTARLGRLGMVDWGARRRADARELRLPHLLGVRGADAALLLDARRPLRPLPDPLHRRRRRHLLPGPRRARWRGQPGLIPRT